MRSCIEVKDGLGTFIGFGEDCTNIEKIIDKGATYNKCHTHNTLVLIKVEDDPYE